MQASAQGADCTSIKDDKDRLACFDDAAKQLAKKGDFIVEKSNEPSEDPIITKARAAVANSLKDPPSARFEGVVLKAEAVCGLVNAKNSYGGYVGKTRFVYVLKSGGIFIEVPITALPRSLSQLNEYEAGYATLKRYCSSDPGPKAAPKSSAKAPAAASPK
jgi:hypothetical protein